MGQDKAVLLSNVSRLQSELKIAGCEEVIIMCGTPQRADLFSGNCIPDPESNLAHSLLTIIENIEGEIQLAPCDAYLADASFFKSVNGVPTDDLGNRQPLLSRFATSTNLVRSKKISEVFVNIQSCQGGIKARNFNTPEEFKEIESLQKLVDQ